MVAIAVGGLCLASNEQTAHAATMILSGSFAVGDVPQILTCCGEPPTGNQFSSVAGNVSLKYNDAVLAPTFSAAPVISLNSFEISFGNALTGPKEFGLSGVVALINQGPGFTNFVIQSNTPRRRVRKDSSLRYSATTAWSCPARSLSTRRPAITRHITWAATRASQICPSSAPQFQSRLYGRSCCLGSPALVFSGYGQAKKRGQVGSRA
jgi:hypothetical protein